MFDVYVCYTYRTHNILYYTCFRNFEPQIFNIKIEARLADANFANYTNFSFENIASIKKFESCRKILHPNRVWLYFMLRPIIRSLILKGFGIKTVVKRGKFRDFKIELLRKRIVKSLIPNDCYFYSWIGF